MAACPARVQSHALNCPYPPEAEVVHLRASFGGSVCRVLVLIPTRGRIVRNSPTQVLLHAVRGRGEGGGSDFGRKNAGKMLEKKGKVKVPLSVK